MKAVRTDEQPRLMGFMTTRILIEEREPLMTNPDGLTVGQLIDKRIEDIELGPSNEYGERRQLQPGETRPIVHSVTFEFPRED